jgi:hypothetical protein
MEIIAICREIHKKDVNKLCGRELRTILVLEHVEYTVTAVVWKVVCHTRIMLLVGAR